MRQTPPSQVIEGAGQKEQTEPRNNFQEKELYYDYWVASNILLSAVFYLLDVVTTILAAKSYRSFDSRAGHRGANGAFTAILCMMITAHLLNAVIFWFTLPPEEQPLFQAYFFPLIQLWRLTKLFWVTCTCRGTRSLESSIKPTYYILATALEAAPQLILQAYVLFGPNSGLKSRTLDRASFFIYFSILACLINAAYNGATAVRLVSRRKESTVATLGISLAGGTYVFASMVLRCQGFMIIALAPNQVNGHRQHHRKYILPLFASGIVSNLIHFMMMTRQGRAHAQALQAEGDQLPQQTQKQQVTIFKMWLRQVVECVALSGISFTVGPLYAMLKLDSRYSSSSSMENIHRHESMIKGNMILTRRRRAFYVHLSAACSTHLLLDVVLGGLFLYLKRQQVKWNVDLCRDTKLIVWRCGYYFHIFTLLFTLSIISVFMYCLIDMCAQDDANSSLDLITKGEGIELHNSTVVQHMSSTCIIVLHTPTPNLNSKLIKN